MDNFEKLIEGLKKSNWELIIHDHDNGYMTFRRCAINDPDCMDILEIYYCNRNSFGDKYIEAYFKDLNSGIIEEVPLMEEEVVCIAEFLKNSEKEDEKRVKNILKMLFIDDLKGYEKSVKEEKPKPALKDFAVKATGATLHDNIHHPSHYQGAYGLECYDVIKNFSADLSGEMAYYQGNAIKYLLRWQKKNGAEDLKKCKEYIDDMLKNLPDAEEKKTSGRYPWGESDQIRKKREME